MKKIIGLLLAVTMMFALGGCNAITIDGEGELSGENSGSGAVGFSVSTLNNPFFVSLSEGAKAAELEGVPGASATIDRGAGFHEAADAALDVVASQTANFNRAEGMNVMENILQSCPEVKGVFAHNDEMALGAVEAVLASGKDIKIVGFDATDDAVAAVKSGKMAATVAQKPELMGETAVQTAMKLINGETVEKSLPVEVELIK